MAFTLFDATLNVLPGIKAGASSVPSIATSSSVMTSTSLGLGTEIDSVDMIDSTRGFAVVSNSIVGRTNHYYMARTSDVGNQWTIVGRLPYPSFKGVPSWNLPKLDFVTTSVGYVSAPGGGRVFVTNDGGRTWQVLSTPGIWPTIRVRGDSTLVVSDVCTGRLPNYGPLQCPSVVSRYRLGRSTPEVTFPIPAINHTPWRAATALATPTPSTLIVQEGGTQPGESTHLLESSDSGQKWRQLRDPCGQLLIQQLLTPSPKRWLLSCFLDGGMMQGTNQLWQSSDGGQRWTLLAYSGEQRYYVGNIADTWDTLAVAGDGRTIVSAVGGAAGGIEYSTDGRHWIPARFNSSSGGAPEWIDSFGANGMLFGNQTGNVWRTFDGITWTPLKLLAGRYRNLTICTGQRGVGVSVGTVHRSSGTTTMAIVFTNGGPRDCYLNGAPSLQLVSGPTRKPIGPLATGYVFSRNRGFTVLRAHGGKASVSLTIQSLSAVSRASCRIRRSTGASIRFDPPATFSLSFGRHTQAVCALISTSQVSEVTPGP